MRTLSPARVSSRQPLPSRRSALTSLRTRSVAPASDRRRREGRRDEAMEFGSKPPPRAPAGAQHARGEVGGDTLHAGRVEQCRGKALAVLERALTGECRQLRGCLGDHEPAREMRPERRPELVLERSPATLRVQAERQGERELLAHGLAVLDHAELELEVEAAGVLAGGLAIELAALEQRHAAAGAREVVSGRAAEEPTADDSDVDALHLSSDGHAELDEHAADALALVLGERQQRWAYVSARKAAQVERRLEDRELGAEARPEVGPPHGLEERPVLGAAGEGLLELPGPDVLEERRVRRAQDGAGADRAVRAGMLDEHRPQAVRRNAEEMRTRSRRAKSVASWAPRSPVEFLIATTLSIDASSVRRCGERSTPVPRGQL